ncbi:thiol reductant ABC exporter subunit CydD [Prauserella oleivorans]|uniref:Thiol reductant ABC exporter subunit CydD n=1 Tax=Prauserella oleivorans TaxID=1478153 RepID=A0ABW5WGM7_9PSEU
MRLPVRTPLTATESARTTSTADSPRTGKGPLGALPALSATARRALAASALLALLNAATLVAQAFLLAAVLADIVAGHTANLTTRLTVLVGVVLVRAVLGWATRVVAARAAAGAKEELRAKAVDHALRLGPEWIAQRGPAQLTAVTTKGLDALDAYFTDYLPALVTAAVVPLAAGSAVLVADWPSAVVIALTLPLLPLFGILIGKYTADRVSAVSDAVQRLSGHLLELVRALPVLAAFRRAEAQAEAVRRVNDRHRRATLSTLRVAFTSAFALELAATLSVALVAVLIGVRLVNGDLSLAIGLGVLILAPECYQPVRAVGTAFHASEDGVESVRRVADVLAEPAPADGTTPAPRGEVRVSDLRVRRRGRYAPDGESFTVRPGETVWLRSPSGAGKTTTLSVLLGFLRPDSGTVTVAGTPLADIAMSSWRENIAWVPQSPAFAGGTVRDELVLAAPTATEADIGAVLDRLGLTGLGAACVSRLSTGQRQRLALARALLRVRAGAWLLLLDEPTAHLDAVNAQRVLAAIRDAEQEGAAVVVAAHERAALETGAEPTTARPGADADPEPDAARPAPLRTLLDRRFLGGAALGAAALLAGVALTATSGWLIARASQQPPILMLTVAVVGVRTFGLARAGLRYLERVVTHDAAFRIAGRLREQLWRALVRLGPALTLTLHRGEGQQRLVSDVDTIRDLLPRVATPPLVVTIVLLAACAVQAAVLPEAGLALAIAMLVGGLLAPAAALAVERRATSTLAAGRRAVERQVLGLFDAAAELIAVGAHRRRRRDLAGTDATLVAAARRQALGAGVADAVIIAVTGGAAVTGTWLAGRAVAQGSLDPVLAPVLALVPLALAEVLALLPPVAQHRDALRQARARLAALTGREAKHTPAGHGDHIELRDADLRWPGTDAPVLRSVTVDIPAGSHVAVIGPSGSGKSTLLAALLGFLPIDHTGHSSRAVLPERVAWAPQEPQLVSTTVAENLRLADPHATDDQLAAAARLAGLPGLDLATVLDSAGAGLSGGQAQRLALARALLAAPHTDVVLLDEPTAHLDPATADRVLAGLREALRGKTVVHVTHRAEEVAGADLVLEVRDGQVTTRLPAQPAAVAGGGA